MSRQSARLDGTRPSMARSGGGSITVPAFSDGFALKINFAEVANIAPTDASTFAIALAQADSNAGQTETVQLKFPTGDFADTSGSLSSTNSFTMRVWLSGTTQDSTNGVTNPTNMDSANNGTVTTFTSTVTGDANPRTHSALGANVPTATITSVIYRGWFKSVNTLVTSTTLIKMHSLTAAFTDITMFSNAALNTTIDHLSGDFTFDLVAAGVNTLAKLQSCQLIASTQDAVAGVTPAVLTIDAGCIEIAGAF